MTPHRNRRMIRGAIISLVSLICISNFGAATKFPAKTQSLSAKAQKNVLLGEPVDPEDIAYRRAADAAC
jgi:hypothetical protein